jgi:uncharacterized protein YbaP (TraB family)
MLRPSAVAADVLGPVPTDEGVELRAIARSKGTNTRPTIKYLETAEESYAPQDRVNDDVWDTAVNWVLDNAATVRGVPEASYTAWFAGDFEEVNRINSLNTINRFPPIKHANITERNYLWLPRIRELVQSANEPTLVLVGVAHLGGSDGLVRLLDAGGLKLTGLSS